MPDNPKTVSDVMTKIAEDIRVLSDKLNGLALATDVASTAVKDLGRDAKWPLAEESDDSTLTADLLSFVRAFYDCYTVLGWGTSEERLEEARALIERAESA